MKTQAQKPLSHIRTTQILIGKEHPAFAGAAYACQIVRRIKNATHYAIRHLKKENGKAISHSDADKWLKQNNRDLYSKLPSAVAQRSTQICGQEWSSYFSAIKVFAKSSAGFYGKPRPPRYANKATTVHIGRNGFKVANGVIYFADNILPPIKTQFSFSQSWNALVGNDIAKEIRIVPKGSCFILEIIFDSSMIFVEGAVCPLLDKSRQAGIDLGIDNLIAIATNQHDIAPVLVKGTALKSINAWYNKRVSQLRSQSKFAHINPVTLKRHRRIKDALHKASSFVVDFCVKNDIGTLVIGHNPGWKTGIDIGKANNQKFVAIPHSILIAQITYKCQAIGITVIVREESYTSKASALDLDIIPNYRAEKTATVFSGKRVNRGLYATKSGLINADVNGALNILRKESGDAVMPASRGAVMSPVAHYPANAKVYATRREGFLQDVAA